METRIRQFAQWVVLRDRRLYAVSFLAVWSVYLLTAHWEVGQVNDSTAAAWPAWALVHHHTSDLSTLDGLPNNVWFFWADHRLVSNRMAGVIWSGVPFAALAPGLDPAHVGALAGATYSALAAANVHLLLRGLRGSRVAVLGAALFALGLPLWTTGAAELWPHGPDACFITACLLLLQRGHVALAGLALAPGVAVRPYLAVSAAVLGVTLAVLRQQPLVVVRFGLGAASLVPLLPLWNHWYYGAANLGGAYQAKLDVVLAAPQQSLLGLFGRNLAGAFLSPEVGLLLYSPVFVVLVFRAIPAWRAAPDWVRGSALAGTAYEVLQLRGNHYDGGGGFYSNRYIVEFAVFLFPLLVLACAPLVSGASPVRPAVVALGGSSIGIHLFGAFSAYHWAGTVQHWWLWYPWHVAGSWGPGCLPLLLSAFCVPVLAVLMDRRQISPATRARPASPREAAPARS